MHKDENEGYLQDRRKRGSICEAPGEGCKELKGGEKIGEGGVGTVVRFGCLFLGGQSARMKQWMMTG